MHKTLRGLGAHLCDFPLHILMVFSRSPLRIFSRMYITCGPGTQTAASGAACFEPGPWPGPGWGKGPSVGSLGSSTSWDLLALYLPYFQCCSKNNVYIFKGRVKSQVWLFTDPDMFVQFRNINSVYTVLLPFFPFSFPLLRKCALLLIA